MPDAAVVVAKFPDMLGQLKFLIDHQFRSQSRSIEYK